MKDVKTYMHSASDNSNPDAHSYHMEQDNQSYLKYMPRNNVDEARRVAQKSTDNDDAHLVTPMTEDESQNRLDSYYQSTDQNGEEQ